jgi:hypothetical protein
MEENNIEQMPIVRTVRVSDMNLESTTTTIMAAIEDAYLSLHAKARREHKVLVGVSQSITHDLGLYVIALVGSAVKVEVIEQQKRMQQFAMPNAATRPRGVN